MYMYTVHAQGQQTFSLHTHTHITQLCRDATLWKCVCTQNIVLTSVHTSTTCIGLLYSSKGHPKSLNMDKQIQYAPIHFVYWA